MYDELVKRLRNAARLADKGLVITPSVCLEAADAIEQLQGKHFMMKKTAEWLAEKVPKWIPVTERLPEKHVFVLVRSKFVKMRTDFINNDGKWYTTPGVTHWMPLPEPPTAEESE